MHGQSFNIAERRRGDGMAKVVAEMLLQHVPQSMGGLETGQARAVVEPPLEPKKEESIPATFAPPPSQVGPVADKIWEGGRSATRRPLDRGTEEETKKRQQRADAAALRQLA